MHLSMRTLTLVGGLTLALGAGAPAEENTPDFASLGSGTVTIELRQSPTTEAYVATVTSDLPDLAAIILREPGSSGELLRITATSATSMVGGIVPHSAGPTVEVSAEMRGKFSTKLPGNVTHLKALEALLVRTDGSTFPLTVRSRTTVANSVLEFAFAATACVTITVNCGNGCATSQECCTRRKDYCVDCIKCSIACPPCVMLP